MRTGVKILKIAGWTVAGILTLVIILLCVLTWTLTSDRLARIINEEADKYLDAKVNVENVNFTVWSTFPRFGLEIDSLSIESNAFKNIPDTLRAKLPADCDMLLKTGHIQGRINLLSLIAGKIRLRNVAVDNLSVNIVQANDTLSNFDIVQGTPSGGSVPRISANIIELRNPQSITYYNHPASARADVALKEFVIREHPDKSNHYRMAFGGKIDMHVGALHLLDKFPFNLDGLVTVAFDPFRLGLSDYAVQLGNTQGHMNFDMNLGDNAHIEHFDYAMQNFRLLDFLRYVPVALPYLSDIEADVEVNASARLTSRYVLDGAALPSLEVDFNIPGGDVIYKATDGEAYRFRDMGLTSRLVFNGQTPGKSYIEIPRFRVAGEGLDVDVSALVTDITTTPVVSADLAATADIGTLSRQLAAFKDISMKGNLTADTRIRFAIPAVVQGAIERVTMSGKVTVKDYDINYKALQLHAGGNLLSLDMGGKSLELGTDTIGSSIFNMEVFADSIYVTDRGDKVNLRGLKMQTHLADGVLADTTGTIPLPFTFSTQISRLGYIPVGGTSKVEVRGFKGEGDFVTTPTPRIAKSISLKTDIDTISLTDGGNRVTLKGITAKGTGAREIKPVRISRFKAPETWYKDTMLQKQVPHTPSLLQVNLPQKFKEIMTRWRVNADLSMKGGDLKTPGLPQRNTLGAMSAKVTFDSISLRNFALRSGETSLKVSGSASNLRQFLLSPVPAPLVLKIDAELDTAQLNQLARAYTRGVESLHGKDASVPVRKTTTDASDTTALLLPRNIVADINAHIRHTKYLNLSLYDLKTAMQARDGVFRIDSLILWADFGHARLALDFNTADIDNINMDMKLGILDIDITRFFQNFPAITASMPSLLNLSGYLTATVDGSLRIYPNMYMDVSSMIADGNLYGEQLALKQNHFIRKITRMMLIPNIPVLHIADIHAHARVYDNMIQVFPFNFEFDRYSLRFAGVNNFNGDLYYHIGINKSPIPFRFGINIEGEFSDPKLRFGGPRYQPRNAMKITPGINEQESINVLKEAGYYGKVLVHKAAVYKPD